MDFNNVIKSHIATPELSAVCKFCHHASAYGRITCDIEVDFDDFISPKNTDIQPVMLYSEPHASIPATYFGPHLINVACPECGNPAMLVDTEMGMLLSAFNQMHIYTQWCCSGHGIGGMYIWCFDPMPEKLQDLFRQCNNTTVEDGGRSIYLTKIDENGNETHVHTAEEAEDIRGLWYEVLMEFTKLPEADAYSKEQKAKWPNLQARYFDKRIVPEEGTDIKEEE